MHEAWMIKALLDVLWARAKGRRFDWGRLEREGLDYRAVPI